MSELHESISSREQMIAEAAYFRAERRGFEGGDPLADWLEAEAEITARLGASIEAREVGAPAAKRRSRKKGNAPSNSTTRRRRS